MIKRKEWEPGDPAVIGPPKNFINPPIPTCNVSGKGALVEGAKGFGTVEVRGITLLVIDRGEFREMAAGQVYPAAGYLSFAAGVKAALKEKFQCKDWPNSYVGVGPVEGKPDRIYWVHDMGPVGQARLETEWNEVPHPFSVGKLEVYELV